MFSALRLRVPTGPARRWLRLVWEWPGYDSAAAADRILPHGQCEVSWELRRGHRLVRRDEHRLSAAFIGPSTTPYWVETPGPMHLFGLLFEPGAARVVLGGSVEGVRSGFVPFEDTAIGARAMARIGEARDWAGRAEAALAVFSRLPPPPVHRATSALLRGWSRSRERSVKSVRAELAMSAPTFVKQVREDLGLRPAEVRQLARFRDALGRVAAGAPMGRAAFEAGYADQAHMSRAFRRFAGLPPSRVRSRSAEHPFHLAETRFPSVQDEG